MQMTLILVLSSTLGAAPMFRQAVARLSRLPRTRNQVFALSCLVVGCLAYLYWGLAIALGPLVSIYPAKRRKRGMRLIFHFCSPRRRRPGRSGSSGSRRAHRC